MQVTGFKTNGERVSRAQKTLDFFLVQLGVYRDMPTAFREATSEQYEEALVDLLADLHHFLRHSELCGEEFPTDFFDRKLNMARMHYESELDEEDPDDEDLEEATG